MGNVIEGRVEKRGINKKKGIMNFSVFIKYKDNKNITHVINEPISKEKYEKISYRDKIKLIYIRQSPDIYILYDELYNPFPLFLILFSIFYFIIRWMILEYVEEEIDN